MGIWSDSSIPVRTMDGATPSAIEDLRASETYQSFIRLQCLGIISCRFQGFPAALNPCTWLVTRWRPVEENGYPITDYRLRYAHTEDAGGSLGLKGWFIVRRSCIA